MGEDEDEANFDKRLKEVQKEGDPGNAETNDIQASGGDGKHEIKTSTTKGVNQNRKTFIQAETSLTKNITNKDTYFRAVTFNPMEAENDGEGEVGSGEGGEEGEGSGEGSGEEGEGSGEE